jgi:hypothetical protein
MSPLILICAVGLVGIIVVAAVVISKRGGR